MHFKSLVYVKVQKGESECFIIDSDVRHDCIITPWLFNVYMDAVMKEVKVGKGRMGAKLLEEIPGLLYENVLVLCCK